MIFSVAWNTMFSDYWKGSVLNFSEMEIRSFLAKKLMERWYLMITGKFLFWTFRRLKYGLFWSQKVDGKIIFTDYWKVLVLNLSEMGSTVFFWPKKLMERWYLLGLFKLFVIFQDLGFLCSELIYLLLNCLCYFSVV